MKNIKLNLSLMVLTFFSQSAHAYFQSQRGDAVGGILLQANNGTEWGSWGGHGFALKTLTSMAFL